MKRLMLLIFALALLVGMGLATSAATAGDVNGQMWWRWTGWNNLDDYDGDNDDNFGYGEMRARIMMKGEFEGGYYKLGLQDYFEFGTWGDDPYDWYYGPEAEDFDVYEANFTLTDFLFDGFDATAGRMRLAYGRERVIGPNDWVLHETKFFDGFKGHYAFEKGWLDLLCLKIQETYWNKYFGEGAGYGDVDMRGLYMHYDAMPDELFFEPYVLMLTQEIWEDDEADSIDNDSQMTFGALVDYQHEGFHAYAEATMNKGTVHYGPDTEYDINSKAFYAGLFYDFDAEVEPFLGFEYNYASGQPEDEDSDDMEEYYAPFASYHDFMGMMDLAHQYGDIMWTDMTAMRFAGGFTPTPGLDVSIDYFIFKEAEVEEDEEDAIGAELDLKLNYMYREGVNFEGGLGMFMPDEDAFGEDADNVMFVFMGTKVCF